ncbi:LlaJI family restriction endonuclease [Vibrio sp. DNB22_19_1]
MAIELNLHTDRELIALLPEYLKKSLSDNNLIQSGDSKVSFCGIVMTQRGINIFFPRNSALPDVGSKSCFRLSALFIKAIRRYTQERASMIQSFDNGEGWHGQHKLSAISDLLEDYCANGLYSQRLAEQVINSGKPDWKRTISRQMPFPGMGGPVYLDIHGSKRRYISDCEVARIHAHVIRELDLTYAWMITGSDASIAQDIQTVPVPKGDLTQQVRVIDLELDRVFSDRDVRLLKLLRDYLKSSHGREKADSVIGVRYFHGMWEHMLDSVLKWNFPVNKLLPVPAYRFIDGDLKVAANKGQRTDTVLRLPSSDQFAVVDAKYYGAQGLGSAPGWPDLVKQFFYAKALSVYCPTASVSNAFIFPGKGPLESVHMLNRESNTIEDTAYPPIKCIYMDPIELIEKYATGKKAHELSELVMLGCVNT